jgi:hypothetical protein
MWTNCADEDVREWCWWDLMAITCIIRPMGLGLVLYPYNAVMFFFASVCSLIYCRPKYAFVFEVRHDCGCRNNCTPGWCGVLDVVESKPGHLNLGHP